MGLGWIGYRAAIGLTDLPDLGIDGEVIAAHELGHNFGRWHAPCGVNIDLDNNYPYDGGIIGEYGFYMEPFRVMPTTKKDVMGYCEDLWISDYTYRGLYRDQRSFLIESPTAQQDSLYVRAQFDQQGEATLLPVYALEAVPDSANPNSDYHIEIINAQGSVIARQPVDVQHAEEPEIKVRAIHATIPRPLEPFTGLRLVHNGQVIAEKALMSMSAAPRRAPSMALTEEGWHLSWGLPGSAALLRYSADNGQTWQVLDIDVTDGEFELDPVYLPHGVLQLEIQLADLATPPLRLNWENPRIR
jgi:hypothetical protein